MDTTTVPRKARRVVTKKSLAAPTADRALKFAESLVRGEPNRSKIALTAVSDKVRELV